MNLGVALAGSLRAWRPMGAGGVETWLAAQTWESTGQPLIVRVPARGGFDLPNALRRELRARGHEPGWPMVDVIEPNYCQAHVLSGLAGWMGIQLDNRRQLAEALCRLAADAPRLVVLELGEGASPAAWLDEVGRLSDLLGKLENPAGVVFVVVITAVDLPAGGYRLDVAWPVDAVSCHDNQDRWIGYLHERVAWHVGGRIDLAQEVDSLLVGLRAEDDIGLEQALDEHARECLARLSPGLLSELRRSIAPAFRSPDTQMPAGLGGADGRGLRIAPWLARALLLDQPRHPERRQLGAAVVCRPLAARLLSRCLDLEQRVVDAVEPAIAGFQPREEAMKTYQRLKQSPQALEHRLTPRGVRDVDSPLDLASLGEVLSSADSSVVAKDAAHDLRLVRNALAHGSPVGWAALTIVDILESRLR